jgi:uncharacterized membrane protein YdjX (TVP38/TMEM64 family)
MWAQQLAEWVHGAGAIGLAVFVAAYCAATLLLLPASLLTAAAGWLYGPLLGTLVVSPVSVAAATLAFLLGRTGARQQVARRAAREPRLAAIDAAIGRQRLHIVTLLRLSPVIPFGLLNYALGLTRVRLRDFALGSFVGMLPATFLYVYLGSAVTALSEIGENAAGAGAARRGLYWAGLAATVAATFVITRVARRGLTEAIDGVSS